MDAQTVETQAVTMCRRNCLAGALGGGVYAALARKPWATGIAADLGAGRIPELGDCVAWGFWWASILTVVAGIALALTARTWSQTARKRWEVRIGGEKLLPGRVFVLLLAGIVVSSAALAWPRLHHSFWGDEESAVARYVVGFTMPKNLDQPDGPLRHPSVRWEQTAFGDQGGGNNHYLYSLLARVVHEGWQAVGHRRAWEFDEAVLRAVPFAAGLLALWAWASVGRRLGRPRAGLVAAALMACHPWHVRFCTEARGYSLMMLFFGLTCRGLIAALETGSAWAWTSFAGAELATLHAWKGMLHPLLTLNLVVGVWLWRRRVGFPDRLPRWLASGTIVGVVFAWLVLPAQPQIAATRAKIAGHGNDPMDFRWAKNLIGETLTGVPVATADPENPLELSVGRLVAVHPVAMAIGIGWLGAVSIVGAAFLFRRSRLWIGLFAAIPAGALLAAVHFKLVLKIELLNWYWTFCVPVGCLVLGLGTVELIRLPGRLRIPGFCVPLGTVGCLGAITMPALLQQRSVPTEAFRDAVMLANGKIESPTDETPPSVRMAWLWRYAKIYEPRGFGRLRTLDDLHAFEEAARGRGQTAWVVVGFPALARSLTPEVVGELEGSDRWELVRIFWAQQPQHTLRAFRLRMPSHRA